MDFSLKPPKKEISRDITSKIETPMYTDNSLKISLDKSNQKPNSKPRNKITREKIDLYSEPRNKIQREKIDLSLPPRNKIERPKFDFKAPPNKRTEHSRPFENLLNSNIHNVFKKYHNETGNSPNYGMNLRKDFIKWVVENNPKISEKVKDIQNNQEISKYIKNAIQNLHISQSEIASKLCTNGLFLNRRTIGNYALKEIFKGDHAEYKKRFDISLDTEIKEKIIYRLNNEVLKYSKGVKHDSLYKIANAFPEVSKSMIDKIAKIEISRDVYKRMWPPTSGTVDPKTKQKIRNLIEVDIQNGNPRSLRSISKNFPGVSFGTIKILAKEMYPRRYEKLWPAIAKIPEKLKAKIVAIIKEETQQENPRTLREIHRNFPGVGADSIKRLAKQVIPKDLHEKIWPPLTTEIPKKIALEIRQTLRDEVNKTKPRSINEIGRFFNVSSEYIRQLAKKTISIQVYENTWKAHELITDTLKKKIIKDIKTTRLNISEIADRNSVSPLSVSYISQRDVFQDSIDAHRNRFPIDENLEIGNFTHLNLNALLTGVFNRIPKQKYYTEPSIYNDKRRPDGLILENNDFLRQRLLNPQNGEYLRDKLDLIPRELINLKSTQLDFTNNISYENLIDKIEKYQSKDTLLVIVGTRWHLYDDITHLPMDDRIKYPENVRIISHNLGSILIGLEGRNKDLYERIIDLNLNHDLDSLKALYNFNLSLIDTHNTEELKEDLIQKGLIKKDFSEYFNFEDLSKQDNKKNQLDLDHFLSG
jgi:hypothetical protein